MASPMTAFGARTLSSHAREMMAPALNASGWTYPTVYTPFRSSMIRRTIRLMASPRPPGVFMSNTTSSAGAPLHFSTFRATVSEVFRLMAPWMLMTKALVIFSGNSGGGLFGRRRRNQPSSVTMRSPRIRPPAGPVADGPLADGRVCGSAVRA